eukprot:2897485-Rhodomonas_salina.1
MPVSSSVIVSNWVAFLSLSASFLGLLVFSLKYKGPTGKEAYYNGFREQNMLGVFINLFCAVAYFAKVVAAHADDDGFKVFTTIKYLDYLTTCPLLVSSALQPSLSHIRNQSAHSLLKQLFFSDAGSAMELGSAVQGVSSSACAGLSDLCSCHGFHSGARQLRVVRGRALVLHVQLLFHPHHREGENHVLRKLRARQQCQEEHWIP